LRRHVRACRRPRAEGISPGADTDRVGPGRKRHGSPRLDDDDQRGLSDPHSDSARSRARRLRRQAGRLSRRRLFARIRPLLRAGDHRGAGRNSHWPPRSRARALGRLRRAGDTAPSGSGGAAGRRAGGRARAGRAPSPRMMQGGNVDGFAKDYLDDVANRLYSSVLADILDDAGYRHQVMRHDVRPLYPGAKVVGRAATMLAIEVTELPADPYKLLMEILDSLRPGEVVVGAVQGRPGAALWGELLSTHTRARGGRGVVLDGLSRDSWGIVDMKFPV